jgi:hypothetical protein
MNDTILKNDFINTALNVAEEKRQVIQHEAFKPSLQK